LPGDGFPAALVLVGEAGREQRVPDHHQRLAVLARLQQHRYHAAEAGIGPRGATPGEAEPARAWTLFGVWRTKVSVIMSAGGLEAASGG
jgi:hypothetical protein